jgi:SpoVK/Ycf46/Vps4 family AAA+-type ATPase
LKSHSTSRVELEQLAQRINVKTDWNQLRLPQEEVTLLHQIADYVKQRNRMFEDYGLPDKIKRGVGISALFTGNNGTGKTMAARVIANDLNLDLYRIDLSTVVSKYIGETEKNLGRLFDAADDSNAILLFDEADSLFGKRFGVKDAYDRYANMSIAYLLQRIESYQGLAILTTNTKDSLDSAFMRRLRFIVDFPK